MGSGTSSSAEINKPKPVKGTLSGKQNINTRLVAETISRSNPNHQNISTKQDSGSEGYGSDASNSGTSQPHTGNKMSKTGTKSRHVKTISTNQGRTEQALTRSHLELETVLKSFEHSITILSHREKWTGDDNETYFKEVQKSLKQHLLENFQKFAHEEQRLAMGKHLVDKGFPKLIFELYERVLGELAQNPNRDETFNVFMSIREILWNFSDSCPAFSKAIAETGLFSYLVDDLSNIKRDVLEEDSDLFIFKSAVAILHNCAHNPDTDRSIYRDVKAVDHLLPFLESNRPQIQMVTLLALAEMIDDRECDKIHGGENVFKFLMDMIKEAREAPDRRKEGFCVSELIDGLSGLAKAEKNKAIIMKTNPLDIFCQVLEDGHEKELLSVCKVVRELAFDQSNIAKIKKEKVLCSKLTELGTHGNKTIREIARGASFQLKLDINTTSVGTHHDYPPIPERPEGVPKTRTLSERPSMGVLPWSVPHIMISYNWENQKEIIAIRNRLVERKYNVWLDLDFMHIYMLEAMAQAVEKAFVVLMCFSERYKLSPNCRLEAEYAFQQKKEIIPLKMQSGYSPDGWLGILLGSKLYYEFSGTHNFEEIFERLYNAIEQLPGNPKYFDGSLGSSGKQFRRLASHESELPTTVEQWTMEQVDQWLRKNKLDPTRLIKLKSLTGEELLFLKTLSTKAPEFFFRCLDSKLDLDNLRDIMNFSKALERLAIE